MARSFAIAALLGTSEASSLGQSDEGHSWLIGSNTFIWCDEPNRVNMLSEYHELVGRAVAGGYIPVAIAGIAHRV
jgi:hypothetical protein